MISTHIKAVYVEIDPEQTAAMQEKWAKHFTDIPLVTIPSPYRSLIGPLIDFLDEEDQRCTDCQLATVLMPELVPAKWWHYFLHNHTARLIKNALLHRRRHQGYQRVIIDIPYHLTE